MNTARPSIRLTMACCEHSVKYYFRILLKVIDATITDRLQAGIIVGNRNYRILGGSNSLIRDHGCYLCAGYDGDDGEKIIAEYIRKNIGITQYNTTHSLLD